LWLVTAGGQLVSSGAGQPDLVGLGITQSPIWGLGKTIALEHPAIWGGLLDLDPHAGAQENAARCLSAMLQSDGEDQAALRQSKRYVPRIVRRDRPTSSGLQIRNDGIYMVTGGLGQVGLHVAQWLADRGAKEIVLVGRTGLPERSAWDSSSLEFGVRQQIAVVRQLESRGVTVRVPRADVADPEQVEGLFASFDATKLRGVIHAAAGLGSSPVADMRRASWRRCCALRLWARGCCMRIRLACRSISLFYFHPPPRFLARKSLGTMRLRISFSIRSHTIAEASGFLRSL
jgi:hypothetical protein